MLFRGQFVSNKTRQSNRNRASKPIQNSFENRDLNEKLHFYHIKPKSKSNNRQWDAKNGSPGRVSNVSGKNALFLQRVRIDIWM